MSSHNKATKEPSVGVFQVEHDHAEMDDAFTSLGDFCHATPERALAFTVTELTFDWYVLAYVLTLKYFSEL